MGYRHIWIKGIFTGLLLLFWSALLSPAQAQEVKAPSDSVTIDSTAAQTPPELQKIMEDIEAEQKAETQETDLEIDGLVVDETVTKSGRDFYDLFYSSWEGPPNASNYTITISELPARGFATILMIDINDNRVVETPLQPRYDIIESIAEQAVQICFDYLLNYEQIQEQLSGDDLSGSGIY